MKIGNTPSNLWIADYSHGLTGSAHDATAFQHTTAAKHPDFLFDGEEFAWADSAYAINA
jgi:DDE superfamily endonuclease